MKKIAAAIIVGALIFGLYKAVTYDSGPEYRAESAANAKVEAASNAATGAEQAHVDANPKAKQDLVGHCMGEGALDLPSFAFDQKMHYCQKQADLGSDGSDPPAPSVTEQKMSDDYWRVERDKSDQEVESTEVRSPAAAVRSFSAAAEVRQDAATADTSNTTN